MKQPIGQSRFMDASTILFPKKIEFVNIVAPIFIFLT